MKLYARISPFLKDHFDEEMLLQVDSVYIESRYPGDFGLLPDGKPSISQAEEFLAFARMVHESIKKLLKKNG